MDDAQLEGLPPFVRATRWRLDVDWSPASALLALRGDRHRVALTGSWAGGGALLGSEPLLVAERSADPFELLAAQPRLIGSPAGDIVGGGWFGHLGFPLASMLERLPSPPPPRSPMSPWRLAFYDHLLRMDSDGRWWFEALESPARRDYLARRRDDLTRRVGCSRPYRLGGFRSVGAGEAGLAAGVTECVDRVCAGELFQANLALRLEADFDGDPLDAYVAGLQLAPAWGAFMDGADRHALVSLSPELFLRRRGREVASRPIKGTARRHGRDPGPQEDAAEALVGSTKDQAENVMIVDLMRNDLGRVCAYGSVRASQRPELEAHPGVWHLVGEVSGRLRDEVDDAQLLRATFPPGSVTGAPKVQALKVISALEGVRRDAYCGAIGFCSPSWGLELNVAIRTLEIADGRAGLCAGGGITSGSRPDSEMQEALDKARPLAVGLGSRLEVEPRRSARPPTAHLPRFLDLADRPDPRLGLLETVRVTAGRPQWVEAHLQRLVRGLADHSIDLRMTMPQLRGELAQAAATVVHGRLRVLVDVAGELLVEAHELDDPPQQVLAGALVVLPGGLGRHKWADRRWEAALREALGAEPILVDMDGTVLEAASGNVWLIEGDRLVTPRADGRQLAGVARGQLLVRPDAHAERVDITRLLAAGRVFLSSSVSGLRVVSSLGAGRPPALR